MKPCWGTQEVYEPCCGILQDVGEMIGDSCSAGDIGISDINRLYAEDMAVTLQEDVSVSKSTVGCICRDLQMAF